MEASATAVVIKGVPPYAWRHGCGPTAAGMLIGYWDGRGYRALFPGQADTQTEAVNAAIAGEGEGSHYRDYAEPLDYSDTSPAPLPDRSEPPPGDTHRSDCLADFMKTSRSAVGNYYGWSWYSDVGKALRRYVTWASGGRLAAVTRNLLVGDGSLTWERYRNEIASGRPVILLVDTNGNGATDHFVTAVGYDNATGRYACLNTWDYEIHWYDFAPLAPGRPWGIFGATTLRLRKAAATAVP
jgi:hypothetical protein